jgi:hypothetical protein
MLRLEVDWEEASHEKNTNDDRAWNVVERFGRMPYRRMLELCVEFAVPTAASAAIRGFHEPHGDQRRGLLRQCLLVAMFVALFGPGDYAKPNTSAVIIC